MNYEHGSVGFFSPQLTLFDINASINQGLLGLLHTSINSLILVDRVQHVNIICTFSFCYESH